MKRNKKWRLEIGGVKGGSERKRKEVEALSCLIKKNPPPQPGPSVPCRFLFNASRHELKNPPSARALCTLQVFV